MAVSKKIVAGALAMTMAVSASAAVSAATITEKSDPKTASAVITTTVDPSYVVTVPEDTTVAFNALSTDFGKIELTEARLNPNATVAVDIDASNTLKNEADETATIAYSVDIDDDGEKAPLSSVGFSAAGQSSDEIFIDIEQTEWDKASAGDYSDTVTFTVRYITPEN